MRPTLTTFDTLNPLASPASKYRLSARLRKLRITGGNVMLRPANVKSCLTVLSLLCRLLAFDFRLRLRGRLWSHAACNVDFGRVSRRTTRRHSPGTINGLFSAAPDPSRYGSYRNSRRQH